MPLKAVVVENLSFPMITYILSQMTEIIFIKFI